MPAWHERSIPRWLDGNSALPLSARAAAAIALLYGAPLARVLTLRTTDIVTVNGRPHMQLGRHPCPFPLGMEHFYHALLGAMITITSTCAHVPRALDVAEPSDPLALEGWLQPENDLAVTDVVSFGGIQPDNSDEHRTGYFPAARAAGTGTDERDALARDWLTYWLLDMGKLGPRDFETWIAGWPRPDFLRKPDLA